MTKQTMSLVADYMKTRDIRLVPSIILGMQEEDYVSGIVEFRNSFRLLRNIAGHEPHTLTSQIKAGNNIGATNLVFIPESGNTEDILTLNMTQFTAWMFEAYLKLDNVAYMAFWRTLMLDLYDIKPVEKCVQFEFKPEKYKAGLLGMFLDYQKYCWEQFKTPKTIAPSDPYIIQLYNNNIRVFWRMAIPDVMSLVSLFVDGHINIRDKANLEGYNAMFREREGV